MSTTSYSRQQILNMEKVPRLKLINSLSGFKSANLIGTSDYEGNENLAVFSSVVHVGSDPPLLGFITRPHTVPRHTYENIKATDAFTINHVNSSIYEKAHNTSGKYRKDLSEFEQCGLKPWYSEHCSAPYVEEAHIRLGLELVEEHIIEANKTVLVIGSIEEIIMTDNFLLEDHTIDLEKAGTVAISGIESYHSPRRLARLDYVRVPKELRRVS